jgi:acyl-CoA thioester hydrolase
MGYVYYGNYAAYYEMGRVELLRMLGTSYREIEENGVMLPVRDLSIRYIRPAVYDEELSLTTTMNEMPDKRIHFTYELKNQKGEVLNKAETTLVFVDRETNRIVSVPEFVAKLMRPYFG